MKKRLNLGHCFIVLKDGVIRGRITKAMNKGLYVVETFLGNVTIMESKIFKPKDFVKACQMYERLYGVK